MRNNQTQDRRAMYPHVVLGTLATVTPPSNTERLAEWYPKALRSGYQFLTGDRQEATRREYERQEMLDGRYPSLG